jgi:hypothetical protein
VLADARNHGSDAEHRERQRAERGEPASGRASAACSDERK